MFKFYLNNIQVQDALNWFDFTETIERDSDIKGLLPKYDVKLKFDAGGYKYLYDILISNGYCNLVELRVDYKCDGSYETILNGYIFISDCKFNLNKCTVECGVVDNNYGARIYNNKTIKAYLNIGRSKNDVTITPCSYDSIQLFTPSTGSYSGTVRYCYSIHDAFRFLIDFMSDGLIGFESDYLSTVTDPYYGIEGLRITTGHEIRTAAHTEVPFISFQDLFQELDKKYPIGFTIVTRNGIPTIKIEEATYFYNNTNVISINNIDDLEQSFNNELLYSSVKFGGPSLETDVSHSFEQIRFLNFINEEYHLQGECNIDKVLDLTGTFIADTNIIEGLFATDTSNDEYDKNIVFIQTYGNAFATNSPDPITQLLPLYYNDNLKNNKVAERLRLQGDVALYLGNNNDLFLASSTSDLSVANTGPVFGPLPTPTLTLTFSGYVLFQNDSTPPNFDTNNRYDTAVSKYTSPANGVYSFECQINTENFFIGGSGASSNTYNYTISLEVYDASNVRQFFYEPAPYTNSTTFLISHFFYFNGLYPFNTVYLPSGHYVKVHYDFSVTINDSVNYSPADSYEFIINILTGSTFSCTQSVNGGGVYVPEEASSYFVSRFEFEKSLSYIDYTSLKLDLSKSIIINNGEQSKVAWIRKSIRKLATGETTWELISNIDNSN